MRTRYKNYADYGINLSAVNHIVTFCRNANKNQRIVIEGIVLKNLPNGMSQYVLMNLLDGTGFLQIQLCGFCGLKEDFYGYRRKAISCIYYEIGRENA